MYLVLRSFHNFEHGTFGKQEISDVLRLYSQMDLSYLNHALKILLMVHRILQPMTEIGIEFRSIVRDESPLTDTSNPTSVVTCFPHNRDCHKIRFHNPASNMHTKWATNCSKLIR